VEHHDFWLCASWTHGRHSEVVHGNAGEKLLLVECHCVWICGLWGFGFCLECFYAAPVRSVITGHKVWEGRIGRKIVPANVNEDIGDMEFYHCWVC